MLWWREMALGSRMKVGDEERQRILLGNSLTHTQNKITLFWLLTLITFSYSSQNEIWGFEMNSGHASILERALSYFILEPKVISLIITWLVPGFQLYSFSWWKGGKNLNKPSIIYIQYRMCLFVCVLKRAKAKAKHTNSVRKQIRGTVSSWSKL